MIAVSDTSPLNYLALIGEIELLPRIFTRVLIPPAVLSELNHARTPPVVVAWTANLPSGSTSCHPAERSKKRRSGEERRMQSPWHCRCVRT